MRERNKRVAARVACSALGRDPDAWDDALKAPAWTGVMSIAESLVADVERNGANASTTLARQLHATNFGQTA